jgi:hypothetical protein
MPSLAECIHSRLISNHQRNKRQRLQFSRAEAELELSERHGFPRSFQSQALISPEEAAAILPVGRSEPVRAVKFPRRNPCKRTGKFLLVWFWEDCADRLAVLRRTRIAIGKMQRRMPDSRQIRIPPVLARVYFTQRAGGFRKHENGDRWSSQEDAALLSFAGEKTSSGLSHAASLPDPDGLRRMYPT